MSRVGSGLLLLTLFTLVIASVLKIVMLDPGIYFWVMIGVAGIFIVLAAFVDRHFYKDFFALKTTKKGMNMGTMILLALVLLISFNFIAIRRNKSFDMTQEKLYTLSDQTQKLLNGLDSDLKLKGFFSLTAQEEQGQLQQLKQLVKQFQDQSPRVGFEVIDADKRPDLVKEYDVVTSGTVVVEYKGKKTLVAETTGASEESLANAIIKVTRDKSKVIGHLTGHGELDLDNEQDAGLFKKSLQDSSYEVKKVNLAEDKLEGLDVLMILGPKQTLFDKEVELIVEFARNGGKLFIAADPNDKHNIGVITDKLGVKFTGKFIADQGGYQVSGNPAVVLGVPSSTSSEIVKHLNGKGLGLFYMAGVLERDPNAPGDYRYEEFIKSSPASFQTPTWNPQLKFNTQTDTRDAGVIGISVTGRLASKVEKAKDEVEEKAGKEFMAVIYSDSEFLKSGLFYQQLNRDLAMNSVAFLAKDDELISIRPKTPQSSKLDMTQTELKLMILGVYIPIPILLLIAGGVVWWRRRGA